jgi:DNA-binding transcriptional LysR family regulator
LLSGNKLSLLPARPRRTLLDVATDSGLELRLLRTFIAVAQRRSFTRAADDLHIAQQAVSQQIKALERSVGVALLRRTPRRVELTPEGELFLGDCRRVVAAADRAVARARAAARGEVGTLRLAYTLTTVWETVPVLLARLAQAHPNVKVEAREVFGADIPQLLAEERYDLALAPQTSYPRGFRTRAVRRESVRIALSKSDPLTRRRYIRLTALADRLFEVWPRDMAPGFYDMVVGTCRTAGFEPDLDERATGNTVWGNLARGRGVALINASLAEQMPSGVSLVDLVEPTATLTYEAIWQRDDLPVVQRSLDAAVALAEEIGWL